jgi:hypothetical protein
MLHLIRFKTQFSLHLSENKKIYLAWNFGNKLFHRNQYSANDAAVEIFTSSYVEVLTGGEGNPGVVFFFFDNEVHIGTKYLRWLLKIGNEMIGEIYYPF